jgi:hypothetical protein
VAPEADGLALHLQVPAIQHGTPVQVLVFGVCRAALATRERAERQPAPLELSEQAVERLGNPREGGRLLGADLALGTREAVCRRSSRRRT